jgi:hypothetical protein
VSKIYFVERFPGYPAHPFISRWDADFIRGIWASRDGIVRPRLLQPPERKEVEVIMRISETCQDRDYLDVKFITLDIIDHFLLMNQGSRDRENILFPILAGGQTTYSFAYQDEYSEFLMKKLSQDIFFHSPTGMRYLRNYPRDGENHRYKCLKGELVIANSL